MWTRGSHISLRIVEKNKRFLSQALSQPMVRSLVVEAHLDLPLRHQLVEEIRHTLFHAHPRLAEILVHADPSEQKSGNEAHRVTAHHQS